MNDPLPNFANRIGASEVAGAHPLDLLVEVDPDRAFAAAYATACAYRELALRAIRMLADTNTRVEQLCSQITALRAELRDRRRSQRAL